EVKRKMAKGLTVIYVPFVTSTAASAGTCGAAILAAFCRKASPSGAGCLGLTGLLYFCHPRPVNGYHFCVPSSEAPLHSFFSCTRANRFVLSLIGPTLPSLTLIERCYGTAKGQHGVAPIVSACGGCPMTLLKALLMRLPRRGAGQGAPRCRRVRDT